MWALTRVQGASEDSASLVSYHALSSVWASGRGALLRNAHKPTCQRPMYGIEGNAVELLLNLRSPKVCKSAVQISSLLYCI